MFIERRKSVKIEEPLTSSKIVHILTFCRTLKHLQKQYYIKKQPFWVSLLQPLEFLSLHYTLDAQTVIKLEYGFTNKLIHCLRSQDLVCKLKNSSYLIILKASKTQGTNVMDRLTKTLSKHSYPGETHAFELSTQYSILYVDDFICENLSMAALLNKLGMDIYNNPITPLNKEQRQQLKGEHSLWYQTYNQSKNKLVPSLNSWLKRYHDIKSDTSHIASSNTIIKLFKAYDSWNSLKQVTLCKIDIAKSGSDKSLTSKLDLNCLIETIDMPPQLKHKLLDPTLIDFFYNESNISDSVYVVSSR